jgi:DNA-binding transcriptional ArsR family regulator
MERSMILESRPTARSGASAAERFNALADPARIAIMSRLRLTPRCVCDLEVELGMASNLLSYHLGSSGKRHWSSARAVAAGSSTGSSHSAWSSSDGTSTSYCRRRADVITAAALVVAGAILLAGSPINAVHVKEEEA